MTALPIDTVLPELIAATTNHRLVVLEAPPGAGKTTKVPLALLDAEWLGDKRIVLLEPRRVAARAAASRMATTLGKKLGSTVGLRTRFDTRVGADTRIEVVTEGVLTRMLLSDPGLDDVGLVIFDEFHERSIHADTGLAFTLETMQVLRPELRALIMSATINADRLVELLEIDESAVVRAEAPGHPVTTEYRPPEPGRDVEIEAAAAVKEVLESDEGDVLVFLPGAAAINRLTRRLADTVPSQVDVTPLHGSLVPAEQDRALQPAPTGRRKVVIATSIAESSVTIEGVRIVIDSGQTRRPQLVIDKGLSGLRTVTASRASADQRRGRAGRQRPGRAIRLWPESDDQHRAAEDPPEILISDLTSLALDLAAWGADGDSAGELTWLDKPPPAALGAAHATLTELGALDDELRITKHGRAMAQIGAPPRLAHLMIVAKDLGWAPIACDVAALLADRDVLRGRDRPADLRLRLEAMEGGGVTGADQAALERARSMANRWRRHLGVEPHARKPAEADLAGLLVSIAYPDRIAQRREQGNGSYLLASGTGATMASNDSLARESIIAVAELEGLGDDVTIRIAAPLSDDELEAVHGDRLRERTKGGWDRRRRDVVFEHQRCLGALVLHRETITDPDSDALAAALSEGVRREGLSLLPWNDTVERLRQRLAFLHRYAAEDWPDVSDDALLATLDDWLVPFLAGVRRRKDLEQVDVRAALANLVEGRRGRDIDRLAPTHVTVPSGSRIPLDYDTEDGPVLAVRLQEMFGLTDTPTLIDGSVPVVIHLLSPAHRPVQVTTDLASFWADGYPQVRKELRGRYPKHHWPEDPSSTPPTNRAKQSG